MSLRIGIVGAGANVRERHAPGFKAIPGGELAAACNPIMTSEIIRFRCRAI